MATKEKNPIDTLMRAIVNGLEDVKAVDIQAFDTEHLSALFERVIVASGNSNRQTKALAMSVLESVKAAGFPKPRMEGAENGEWIIVDCGAAVVHIMQPVIRSYYSLEEIWGGKPLKKKADKLAQRKAAVGAAGQKAAGTKTRAAKVPVTKVPVTKIPVTKAPAKKTASKAPAKKVAVHKAPAKKVAAKKTADKKA